MKTIVFGAPQWPDGTRGSIIMHASSLHIVLGFERTRRGVVLVVLGPMSHSVVGEISTPQAPFDCFWWRLSYLAAQVLEVT